MMSSEKVVMEYLVLYPWPHEVVSGEPSNVTERSRPCGSWRARVTSWSRLANCSPWTRA